MSQLEKSPERLSPPDLRFSEDELILLLDTALAVTYTCKTYNKTKNLNKWKIFKIKPFTL